MSNASRDLLNVDWRISTAAPSSNLKNNTLQLKLGRVTIENLEHEGSSQSSAFARSGTFRRRNQYDVGS
uniref:Uncharacterized protein n=1 Tax=Vespula pensylvanica TaxID=30213 RepID=A0A834UHU3_VESPE|nr:hypothetical protein H0235_001698 [Vespula pensylvanica]